MPKKIPKLACRKLAEIYKIGKTAPANILKNEKKIREQHEMFCEKSKKRNRHGKYNRCCASNIYPNGVMLKEEAMTIKEQLQNSNLDDFGAWDVWLDCWKTKIFRKRTSYCWRGRRRVYRNGYFLDGEDKRID